MRSVFIVLISLLFWVPILSQNELASLDSSESFGLEDDEIDILGQIQYKNGKSSYYVNTIWKSNSWKKVQFAKLYKSEGEKFHVWFDGHQFHIKGLEVLEVSIWTDAYKCGGNGVSYLDYENDQVNVELLDGWFACAGEKQFYFRIRTKK